jgi:hypothetical protein
LREIIQRDVFGGMTSSLDDALNETLGLIQRALDHIRAGDGAETELRNVHACLLDILELVERDPGIEAASDDLYAAAKELALGVDKGTRMARLLNDSLLRFRERLATARPRELRTRMLLSLHRLLERRSLKRASCSAGRSPTLPSGQSSQRRQSNGPKPRAGRTR